MNLIRNEPSPALPPVGLFPMKTEVEVCLSIGAELSMNGSNLAISYRICDIEGLTDFVWIS